MNPGVYKKFKANLLSQISEFAFYNMDCEVTQGNDIN